MTGSKRAETSSRQPNAAFATRSAPRSLSSLATLSVALYASLQSSRAIRNLPTHWLRTCARSPRILGGQRVRLLWPSCLIRTRFGRRLQHNRLIGGAEQQATPSMLACVERLAPRRTLVRPLRRCCKQLLFLNKGGAFARRPPPPHPDARARAIQATCSDPSCARLRRRGRARRKGPSGLPTILAFSKTGPSHLRLYQSCLCDPRARPEEVACQATAGSRRRRRVRQG